MPKVQVKTKVQAESRREFLREKPEVSLFMACCGMVQEMRCLACALDGGRISRKTFLSRSDAVLGQLIEMVCATERFDVLLPVMDYGQFSPFFWRWFNWWEDYMKGLSPAQLDHIHRLAQKGLPGLNEYRPKGDWLRYRHTPAFMVVVSWG